MRKLKPPVFIVGSPRSGTTWLYHILLSAGGFAIYRTEPKVFTDLGPVFGQFRSRKNRERFLKYWIGSEEFLRSGLSAGFVETKILDECSSTADCQRILMDGIASQQDAERWSDCTPDNLLLMTRIQRSLPDALFVHIVRDGRDVALSLAQQGWVRPLPRSNKLLAAAQYWGWAVSTGHRAGRRLRAGSYLEVYYHDLVQRYEDTLARIGAFIGQELDPERIQRTGIGSVSKPNTSFAAAPVGVDRWRAAGAAEITAVERAIGPELREMGFALHGSSNSTPSSPVQSMLYHSNFSLRLWLRTRTPLSQWLSDTPRLEIKNSDDGSADKTLRPGLYPDYIRSCVTVSRS